MVEELESTAPPRDVAELARAFSLFMQKAAELEASHDRLQVRVRELTEELAAKVREVQALKDHLESVLESVAEAVVAVDTAGRVTSFNRAAEDLFGRRQEQIAGRDLSAAGELAVPLAELVAGALERGERRRSEERVVRRADGSEAVLLLSVALLRDSRGRLAGAVGSAQDVTQLRDLERALARRERLAALGGMAAVLSHEIRNPLGSIQLYAGLLERSPGMAAPEREVLGKLSRGIAGLNKLVEDMLAFAREIVPQRRRQDVRLAVESALESAAAELTAKHVVVERLGWDRPLEASVDGTLLSRAFLNLLVNAAESVEIGGRVEIKGRCEESGGRRFLVFRVADNGPGLPAGPSEQIFNPFYTTKAQGTGLGLAVVARIVAAHGGEVQAENLSGGGATFTVRLPVE